MKTEILPHHLHLIGSVIDHPSVYMGGPSRNAIRKAKRIWEALWIDELQPIFEEIQAVTKRHPLEAGFNHSKPTIKELEERLADISWLVKEVLNKYGDEDNRT